MPADENVCSLDAKSVKKAKEELHEDPSDRQDAVNALRTWILNQPHLKYRTDTDILLQILRTRKFSQLESRAMVEKNLRSLKSEPKWFRDVDTHDPKILAMLDTGVFIPLPGNDPEGRKIILSQRGNVNPDSKQYDHVDDFIRTAFAIHTLLGRDDMAQVNGLVHVYDFSKYSLKHQKDWGIDLCKRIFKYWIGCFPGRFKGFHIYNGGTFIDFILMLFKTYTPKKFSDRLYIHGSNLENLYSVIPKHMLPVEYLPDDYEGPNAGTCKQIIENLKKELMAEDFRQEMMHYTSDKLWIDDSKKPDAGQAESSFRKLNID